MLTGNNKGRVGGKPKSDIGQYGLESEPKADGWQGLAGRWGWVVKPKTDN